MSKVTKIPQDFSCPFVECAQFRYCTTKICSRWEAWFNDTWSKIHEQGLEAIERRRRNDTQTVCEAAHGRAFRQK